MTSNNLAPLSYHPASPSLSSGSAARSATARDWENHEKFSPFQPSPSESELEGL